MAVVPGTKSEAEGVMGSSKISKGADPIWQIQGSTNVFWGKSRRHNTCYLTSNYTSLICGNPSFVAGIVSIRIASHYRIYGIHLYLWTAYGNEFLSW